MKNNFFQLGVKTIIKMEMKKIGFSFPCNIYSTKLYLENNSYLALWGISCFILSHISVKSDLVESNVGLSEL
jgi:hypothetical protein